MNALGKAEGGVEADTEKMSEGDPAGDRQARTLVRYYFILR